MNNELVAAVARALCEADRGYVTENEMARCRELARAVIPVVLEGLREPTPAMLDAFVSRALQVSIDSEGGWSNYGRNQWRAMLDAAIRGLGE